MKILTTPNPILTQPAKPVAKISAKGGPASGWDKKILKIIEEMKRVLLATENPKGVGLAAPQIGQPLRIFLTKPYPKSAIKIFINPQVVWESEEMTDGVPQRHNKLEGCLSIPKVWGLVKRHKTIKLKYQTPDNKSHQQPFSGFLATIIQHELDHLDGRLFSSRVVEQKGKFYKIGRDKEGKEVLEEISI